MAEPTAEKPGKETMLREYIEQNRTRADALLSALYQIATALDGGEESAEAVPKDPSPCSLLNLARACATDLEEAMQVAERIGSQVRSV